MTSIATTVNATTAAERLLLAKDASRDVALLGDVEKRDALRVIAGAIEEAATEIVAANAEDLERGRATGLSEALQDRLRLDGPRVFALAEAVRAIATLPDPVGRVLEERTLPNGVQLTKVSAARLAAASGVAVLVTSADLVGPALDGAEIGTWFVPNPAPVTHAHTGPIRSATGLVDADKLS